MIEREDRDGIAIVRLAHGKANALDLELLEALSRELLEAEQSKAEALVITGTGSIFSAGVDLFRVVDGGTEYIQLFLSALTRTFKTLFELSVPVVAAINGHAIAGGYLLTQCCDIRLMARGKGRIGAPELLVGVPFPPLALEIVLFTTPPQHVQSLVYGGMTLTPDEALRYGTIDEILEPDQLLPRALETAGQLSQIPRVAFRLTKQQIRAAVLERFARVSRAAEAQVAAAWSSPETHDRIRAYLAKTVRKKALRPILNVRHIFET